MLCRGVSEFTGLDYWTHHNVVFYPINTFIEPSYSDVKVALAAMRTSSLWLIVNIPTEDWATGLIVFSQLGVAPRKMFLQ